jgi:threonine aldolase
MKIDLRSDTVTVPTPPMLNAMMNAEIGDDVLGDPSSVSLLERHAAKMFNMEAALFCPSGTMTNQIAALIGSKPMSSIILEESSHMFVYELGGLAFNARAQPLTIRGERGLLTAAAIEPLIVGDSSYRPDITGLPWKYNEQRRRGDL